MTGDKHGHCKKDCSVRCQSHFVVKLSLAAPEIFVCSCSGRAMGREVDSVQALKLPFALSPSATNCKFLRESLRLRVSVAA